MKKTAKRKAPLPRTMHRPSRSKSRRGAAQSNDQASSWSELLPRLGRGLGLSAAVSLVGGGILLLAAAAILIALEDPGAGIIGAGAAVLLLTALIGGFVTAREAASRTLLCGVCSAGVLLLLTWMASFCIADEAATLSTGIALALRAAVVLFSVLGASLGRNFPK
ncbi:MAG: YrzE family protein [Clostridia bacterium]|nr:YrzE family protein [Clostridia bacterium]